MAFGKYILYFKEFEGPNPSEMMNIKYFGSLLLFEQMMDELEEFLFLVQWSPFFNNTIGQWGRHLVIIMYVQWYYKRERVPGTSVNQWQSIGATPYNSEIQFVLSVFGVVQLISNFDTIHFMWATIYHNLTQGMIKKCK